MNIKYFKKGIRDACGIPLIGLALSMFTFGAYLRASNFSILQTFLSTFFAFALPGQFVMAETLISGGNLINVFLAVLLTNARLFPMTIHIIPTLKSTKISGWKYYIICHFIAVTAWINYIAIYKRININYRYYYFFGLGGTLWFGSVISTVLGFSFSSLLSYNLLIGLVFLNPMYFLLMTVKNLKNKKLVFVFLVSIFFTLCSYPFLKDWGIIFSGVISGSIGYFTFRKIV